MTATVLTFTRDWQGPARERDTWAKCRDDAALQRICAGYYDEFDDGAPTNISRISRIGPAFMFATPFLTLALIAWGIWL